MAAEDQEQDKGKWIIYDYTSPSLPFSDWLEEWTPSKVNRDDGVSWICVQGSNVDLSQVPDVKLLEAWRNIETSGEPINLQVIYDLARTFQDTSGKWLLHVDTGIKVDRIWKNIASGIVEGKLPANSAKVSSYAGVQHAVCIYNNNFTDEQEVCHLERGIRNIGIKSQLSYKPEIFTHIGLYRHNNWNIRPTIYKSDYELTTKQSIIKTNEESPRTLTY
ncbi:UPF0696 protein C11orf68 homolog [Procambarus clarkii]|uniref:UPF0696 protein C11orf68 homolog n=1 Tax=Procambarus clarkii TaxID=6728 RepID=UPI0037432EED